MLGADPEFLIMRSEDNIIDASSHYEFNERVRDSRLPGSIGTDGCSTVGEIRPYQCSRPQALVERCGQILKLGLGKVNDAYRIFAGSEKRGYALGGHIHVSFADRIMDSDRINILVSELARYVSIPMRCVMPPHTFRQRVGQGYGALYDHRVNKGYVLEYRSPSSWLCDRKLAEALIFIAHEISRRYMLLDYAPIPRETVDAYNCYGSGGARDTEHREKLVLFTKQMLEDIKTEKKQYILDLIERNEFVNEEADLREVWQTGYEVPEKIVQARIQNITLNDGDEGLNTIARSREWLNYVRNNRQLSTGFMVYGIKSERPLGIYVSSRIKDVLSSQGIDAIAGREIFVHDLSGSGRGLSVGLHRRDRDTMPVEIIVEILEKIYNTINGN
jgi:hypothetical protein